ncbi:hypothetical protein GQ457_06G018000 [Hibiscus cannabinus]
MSEPSENSRLPKKQRRRDEAPPDSPLISIRPASTSMDCDGHDSFEPIPSYKDKLTGGSDHAIDDDLVSLDDDDIDLQEEDVRTGEADGIPFIIFSDCIKDLAIKSMEFTLVLKVLGRQLVNKMYDYNHLMIGLWAYSNIYYPLQSDYCDLETFSSRSDFIHVLTDGPWTIFGHYITVEPWSADFDPQQDHPSRIFAWVRLPGLTITWYKRSLIKAIGARIGKVVKIDYQTDYGRRGRFVRMAVKINLKQPLVSKIAIKGQIQFVEYESLPMVCFKCGTYGHVTECFPLAQVNAGDTTVQSSPTACRKVIPSEPFGPWMLVERRQRRQNKPSVPIETHVATTPPQGSKFNPIFMEDKVVDELGHHPIPPTDLIHEKLQDPTPILPTEEPVPPSPAAPLATNDKTMRTKSKGKIPLSVRKPPTVVLAPKNTNIMPQKSAMEISPASAPIVVAKSPAKHGAPTSSAVVDTEASSWNRDVFGSIGRNNKILKARLRGVQSCLDQRRTRNLLKLEKKLLTELEVLLDLEEQLWKQKARMDWIHFGDRNTHYFHSKAIARRRRITITMLKDESGVWCDDDAQLRTATTTYFSSLFAVTDSAPVFDIVTPEGTWDWDTLHNLVAPHVIDAILHIVPPNSMM